MKFIYADSLDFVDPNYNFIEDRSDPNREVYWDDQFPHEYLKQPPYDGILVSRGIVGDHKFRGKYTDTQSMRFRRVGAKKFLRIDKPEFSHLQVFGDCGAFSYANLDLPPYTPAEIVEFYEDGGFTHGCSVDHIIFEHDNKLQGIRIPQATESNSLKRLSSKGLVAESTLISQEKAALASVRDYDKGQASLEDVLDAVLTYARSYLIDPKNGAPVGEKKIEELSEAYRKMLQDRPWQECDCEVCKRVGVEAAIFRASTGFVDPTPATNKKWAPQGALFCW
ncbi:MAG: hypothetical protein RIC85_04845 [Gammaproteobacteria bacterium]